MKTIRNNTFETNSSSTHSLSIVSGEEFDKFKNDETLYYYGDLFTFDEIYTRVKKEKNSEWLKDKNSAIQKMKEIIKDKRRIDTDYDDDDENAEILKDITDVFEVLETYESLNEDSYLEFFEEKRVINGVEVVAFGNFGFDG